MKPSDNKLKFLKEIQSDLFCCRRKERGQLGNKLSFIIAAKL